MPSLLLDAILALEVTCWDAVELLAGGMCPEFLLCSEHRNTPLLWALPGSKVDKCVAFIMLVNLICGATDENFKKLTLCVSFPLSDKATFVWW